MLNWLYSDPKTMNYVIMGMYTMNVAWWGTHGRLADCCYWLCAFGITATVTWGYQH